MRILLLLSAALIAALSTTYTVVDRASRTPASEAPATEIVRTVETVDILVAARPLSTGTLINATDLRWQAWPEDHLAEDFLIRTEVDLDDIIGSVVRHPVTDATPLQPHNLVQPGDRGFLAAVLPAGKRAISVAVDETTGLAGLIFPGDRVDVVMTHRSSGSDGFGGAPGSRQASETILSGIRVLALDQRLEDVEGLARQARTATLEVTPDQAEIVTLARSMGELTLTLQSAHAGPPTDQPAGGPAKDDRYAQAGLVLSNYPNGNAAAPLDAAVHAATPPERQPRAADSDKGPVATFTLDTEVSRVLGRLMERLASEAAESAPGGGAGQDPDAPSGSASHDAHANENETPPPPRDLQVVRGSSVQMLTFDEESSVQTQGEQEGN